MNKLDFVTEHVCTIVTMNCYDNRMQHVFTHEKLSDILIQTDPAVKALQGFFGIEFEQEQISAWETVQNIIDDVMNLWVSPITDPVVKGANLETIQRLQRQLGESEKAFEERVKIAVKPGDYFSAIVTFKDGTLSLNNVELTEEELYRTEPPFRMENGHLMVNPAFMSKPGRLDPPTEAERAAAAKNPSEVINRIEREDVDAYRGYVTQHNALDRYQRIATKSAIYPGQGTPLGLAYVALKLNGEAGEFAEHVGKAMRDDEFIGFATYMEPTPDGKHKLPVTRTEGQLTSDRRTLIIKEIGDVLWYLSAACNELGINLSEAALTNLEKLADRTERNALRGSGDVR